MPILFALLALLGAGTTAELASNTVPGDTLYPVKIHLNENLESIFALTAKADAQVDLTHVGRRLVEAEQLASAESLSPDKNTEIQNLLTQNVVNLNKHLRSLKEDGATSTVAQIKTRFDGEFTRHEKKLSDLSKKSTTTQALLTELRITKQESELDEVMRSDSEAESKPKTGLRIRGSEGGDNGAFRPGQNSRGEDDERERDDNEDDERPGSFIVPVGVTPSVQNPTPTQTPAPVTATTFTLAQVAQHKTSTDCYTVVSGSVYNMTSWIKQHPGGSSSIIGMCGVDATASFMAQHGGQGRPEQELVAFKIGVLK